MGSPSGSVGKERIMPYIEQGARQKMKKAMGDLMVQITTEGELNYAFSKMARLYLKKHPLRYAILNEIMGVFESAKLEFYRRVVTPYEETKIIEHGDI
jgi:hypothetical protein